MNRETGPYADLTLRPIGRAHTEYAHRKDAPFQGGMASQESELEISEEFSAGLKDIEKSTHLIVLYWAHLSRRDVLQTVTPWGPEVRGVFACRSPARPNPLLFCVVELVGRSDNRLLVRGLDAVDGSPIIDIKPYSTRFDCVTEAAVGWLDKGRHSRE